MNELTEDIRKGAAKQKTLKSTAQLPVYRAASNVLFVLTELVAKSPRKIVRLVDCVLTTSSEALKCISVANACRGEERLYYLSLAEANITVVKTFCVILHRMRVMSDEQNKRLNNLLGSVSAQVAGWRDSVKREGHS